MVRFALAVGAVMAWGLFVGATAARAQSAAYWNDVTQQALEFEPSGNTVGFENGYGRGEITPRPAFTNANGYICREFEAAVGGRVYVDTACRGGDGVWFLQRQAYAPPPPPRVVYRSAPVYYAPPPVVYVERPRYYSYYPGYAYYPAPYPATSFSFVFRSGDRDRYHHHHGGGGGRGRGRH